MKIMVLWAGAAAAVVATTGAFAADAYIEADGTQAIVTDYYPNPATKIALFSFKQSLLGGTFHSVGITVVLSLIGILARVADCLAKASVPLFAVSTYNTDYILFREQHEPAALDALKAAGYDILEE